MAQPYGRRGAHASSAAWNFALPDPWTRIVGAAILGHARGAPPAPARGRAERSPVHGLAADRPRRRLTNSKERRPQRRGKRRSSKRVTDRGSLEQRRGRGGEDVGGVGRVEVDRSVDLEDVPAAALVGGDVDAGEVDPNCRNGAERERGRRLRRAHPPAAP
jgi:hypothetical protein